MLVRPLYLIFTLFVYLDRNVELHLLSKLFTNILHTFPDICSIPKQVAIVFIIFLVVRWQINLTPENYNYLLH
jgi:hypothetical protein